MPPIRGYTATKDQLLGRLARIEGQIRGIEGMVREDRYCIDILTQIGAARAEGRDAKTGEMMAAEGRLMRRG
jgi:DNA-binding FrmR family transcriptional regulator